MFSKIKINRRQMVLLIAMLIIGFFFVKRYVNFSLPTASVVDERLQHLNSLRGDLKMAQKQSAERMEEIRSLRTLATPYWFAAGQRALIDQEINKEFAKLLRQAHLPANQKVDLQRNKVHGMNHIQEVIIRLELRGVSMKEVSRFLNEVHKFGDKLSWNYCRIEPDNPRNPKNVNFSARFRALVLNSEAVDYLNQEPTEQNEKNRGTSTL
jgi:hypothetical protein